MSDNPSDKNEPFGAPIKKTMDGGLDVGTKIGPYAILGTLGFGSGGAVYTGEHTHDGRSAAIKVMHRHMASSSKMIERFMREARTVDVIDHPNIVTIYDMGTLPDGRPYQVMELVPGITLASALETRGRFDPESAHAILEPLCSALQEAHDAGVLHRNLKLSNVMVDLDVDPIRVTLLDFGIAKLMDGEDGSYGDTTGVMTATPQVMAPEQINGDILDARTDQYALGVMLFSMLTGRPPFQSSDVNALLQQHLSATAPRVSEFAPVSAAIDDVVARAIQKVPNERYDSIEEMFDEFSEAVAQAPKPTRKRMSTQAPEPLVSEAVELPDPRAVGVYVKAAMQSTDDTFDDDLLDDLSLCLDEAEGSLRDAGFQIVLATGTSLFGVKLLPESESDEKTARRRAISLAKQLQHSFNAEAMERAVLGVYAHVDTVSVRGAGVAGEVTGGPLTKTDVWTTAPPRDKVRLSSAILEGIESSGSKI